MSRGTAAETLGEDEPALSRVRAQRRQHLLDSAQRTLLRDGFHGATMERVAEDAGVSKQTLYNYFEDKEDLFVALLGERKAERLVAALQPSLDRIAAGEVEAGLHAALLSLIGVAVDGESMALFRLVLDAAAELPGMTARMRDRIRERVFERITGLIRDALAQGAAGGRLRPVDGEMVARLFFGVVCSYTVVAPVFAESPRSEVPPERLAAALADLLSRGLLPRGG